MAPTHTQGRACRDLIKLEIASLGGTGEEEREGGSGSRGTIHAKLRPRRELTRQASGGGVRKGPRKPSSSWAWELAGCEAT